MKTVFRFFNPIDAQMTLARLRAAHIDAELEHELSGINIDGYAMASGGIKLLTPDDQADDARNLIESEQQGVGTVDSDGSSENSNSHSNSDSV